jgi:hypothetical protein
LHNAGGQIVRAWQLRRWIVCRLEFRGRRRQVMTPQRYTELFFLDEATALAAGHRPCAECRREQFEAFRTAWRKAQGGKSLPTAGAMDSRLHAERVTPDGTQRVFEADLAELPDGAFIHGAEWADQPCLIRNGKLHVWTPGGYETRSDRPGHGRVTVLTPKSTVATLRAGYLPEVHGSADIPRALR